MDVPLASKSSATILSKENRSLAEQIPFIHTLGAPRSCDRIRFVVQAYSKSADVIRFSVLAFCFPSCPPEFVLLVQVGCDNFARHNEETKLLFILSIENEAIEQIGVRIFLSFCVHNPGRKVRSEDL